MKTVRPTDGMVVKESVRFEPGVHVLPRGVTIQADGVRVEGKGATLAGVGRQSVGISVAGVSGVHISGVSIRDYYHGIKAERCSEVRISDCQITSTAEVAPNTVFLDIWLAAERAYGGAICLIECSDCLIVGNDLQHQMNGLLTYDCKKLTVFRNQCNYNSGWGIHLYRTCDSIFEENSCDYCCRFERREGGLHHGHVGADAAGFLGVMSSCRNKFLRNSARLGGDGFFFAGLSPDHTPCGCDDNLFEENDASLSPNIAFEATFCARNVFRRNHADRCNYGFWCGYSQDFVIEDNHVMLNRQAGIAAENGIDFKVTRNTFQSNGHGILIWSRYHKPFVAAFPQRDTSHGWVIEDNRFFRNGIGIRIAANQDHGIRSLLPEHRAPADFRPHSHTIRDNDIQDNRIGIELVQSDKNIIHGNILNDNVEANIRLEDAEANEILHNLGSQGAYL